jgi:acyl transferase domain-containing protein/trans-aconitate methyltransferase/acyl carrier protein
VASVLKAVLALQHEQIPAQPELGELNPHLAWNTLPVTVPREPVAWPRGAKRRYAGVSSFGISGTNAHVVLEESPEAEEAKGAPVRSSELLVVSGKSEAAVQAQAARLAGHLQEHPEVGLGDLCLSLGTTRSAMEERVAIVAGTVAEARQALEAASQGETAGGVVRGRASLAGGGKVVFVFPGQGSQWLGMGRELLEQEPAFRFAIEACDRAIRAEAGFSVLEELGAPEGVSELGRIDVVQPLLFAMVVGLSALWQAWGVKPDAVVGHSMGEVAAAYVAGALTLEDAVSIICRRSKLLRRISGHGEMALVELTVEQAEQALERYQDRLSVAVSNSPRFTVLSGEPSALGEVLGELEKKGVFQRRVKVDVASHSPQVEPLREELVESLKELRPKAAVVPMRSTVTCGAVQGPELVAEYWADNVRRPVRFAQVVKGLIGEGYTVFVEMSPHPILQPSVEEILGSSGRDGVAVGSLRRHQGERRALLEALGALWVKGHPVAWDRQFPDGGRKLPLPTYAWQRERYWIDAAPPAVRAANCAATFYNAETRVYQGKRLQGGSDFPEAYLTFGLFPAIVPGYSWLQTHADPEAHVEHAQLGLKAQRELRAALFRHVDLSTCERVLDFGCGYSTDLLLLAKKHPALRLDGYTISAEQAQIGAQRVREAGLEDRVRVYNRDSAAEPFPGDYDLAFGFEVAHHIHDKQGLFANLSSHLKEGGQLILADFISNTGKEIAHQGTSSFVITADQWAEVLSKNGLRITHLVDVSREIANFLHDPDFGRNLEAFAARYGSNESIAQTFTTYDEIVQGLRRGLVSYVLFTIRGEAATAEEELRRSSRLAMDAPVPYAETVPPVAPDARAMGPREEGDDLFLELSWEHAPVPGPKVTAGRSLVLGGGESGARLAAALVDAGQEATHAAEVSNEVAALKANVEAAFGGRGPTGIVHLGSLDAPRDGDTEAGAAIAMRSCDGVLALVQALAGAGFRNAPRLWLVTRGVQPVGDGDVDVTASPLLGLGRAVAMEHPELRCARVDLDPAPGTELDALTAELLADDAEEEIAWRRGTRHVSRLTRRAPSVVRTERVERGVRSYRLENDALGALELVLRSADRRPLGPGEVEIEVEAAGIELVDVLRALGVAASEPAKADRAPFGRACAGRVVVVGPGVEGLAPDQPVIALAEGALRSHAIAPAALVLPRPVRLSSVEAAALPVSHVAARHAFLDVARLQPSERVLIHSAGSEVGLAAVHCARHIGARIFATASTPERRAHLESLGIDRVSDAHSDAFVQEVLAWTGGEGVDVVLNPLSDAPLSARYLRERSLPLLRTGGRFVELGVEDGRSVKAGLDCSGAVATVLRADLASLMREEPARVRQRLEEALALVDAGGLPPPVVASLPASRAVEAFARVARSQHVGTMVLTFDEAAPPVRVPEDPVFTVRGDGSYLVTGGLGGLGLSVAGLLAQRGAGHLVLVGRSGATQPGQQEAIAQLAARGTRVTVARADVADPLHLKGVLETVAASGLPLRGVIHAAGVLEDGLLLQQTPERFRRVMAPKVLGAWNVHCLTHGAPLDFFVMYASTSGVFGAPGQGNYAAANTFLDALAHHRRARGLPGLSIDWGPFADVGLAAAQENRGARMASRGLRNLTPAEGLSALAKLVDSRRVQTAVLSFELRQWLEFYPFAATSRTLSRLRAESAAAERPKGDRKLVEQLAAAVADERAAILEDLLRKQVSLVLRIAESKVDPKAPLTGLGMDSLMGLELRNRIEAMLGVKMAATILWTYPAVAALSDHLLEQMGLADAGGGASAARPNGDDDQGARDLAELDEERLLALLDQAVEHEKRR